jgi:hypothetical protein
MKNMNLNAGGVVGGLLAVPSHGRRLRREAIATRVGVTDPKVPEGGTKSSRRFLIPSWNHLVVYSALDRIYARKRIWPRLHNTQAKPR